MSMKTFFLAATFCLLSFVSISQQSGTLDKSFGANGIVVSSNPNGNNQLLASVVLNDDKIFTISSYPIDQNNVLLLLSRYLPDGKPDPSFGDNGQLFEKDFPIGVSCMTVQKDNKVLIAGYAFVTNSITGSAVTRLNLDGSLDSSFGKNGTYVDSSNKREGVSDITQQADGKIALCGGYAYDEDKGIYYVLFMRLNEDGVPDKSFGVNGKAVFDASSYEAISIAQQPDGKLISAGDVDLLQVAALLRINTDGTPDKSFGNNGLLITNFDKYYDFYNDICMQPDGKIIAVGTGGDDSQKDNEPPYVAIARYNPDGTLDKSFGKKGDGKAKAFLDYYALGYGITLQNNGKIVVTGSANKNNTNGNFGVARFTEDGLPDTSFGINGETTTDVQDGSADVPQSIFIQSDGNIIVSGITQNADLITSTALARYIGDPVKQQNPVAKKIRRWIHNHILNWQGLQNDDVTYYSVERSNGVNGFKEIAQVKSKKSKVKNDDAVYSFNVSNASANSRQLTANSPGYYRIRAVSNDGSNVVSDVISDESFSSITVSPNPVKDVLKISGLTSNQKSTINIISRNGNVLLSAATQSSTYNFNVAQLQAGLYNAQIITNGIMQSVKFLKE